MYNKRTKTVMESINVVIDDTISEKGIDNEGEEQILKKNEDDDDVSQGENAEKESPEEESTPPIPRRVTRSTQGSLVHSPLLMFNLQSCVIKNLALPKDHHQA